MKPNPFRDGAECAKTRMKVSRGDIEVKPNPLKDEVECAKTRTRVSSRDIEVRQDPYASEAECARIYGEASRGGKKVACGDVELKSISE